MPVLLRLDLLKYAALTLILMNIAEAKVLCTYKTTKLSGQISNLARN